MEKAPYIGAGGGSGGVFCALPAAVKSKLILATSPAQDYTHLAQISIILAFRAVDHCEDVQSSPRLRQKQYLNMKHKSKAGRGEIMGALIRWPQNW